MLQTLKKKDLQQPAGLPQSEESERAVLAAALLSPHVIPLISGRLVAEDFYLERHQLIYQTMIDLQENGSEIDLRTLQASLELRGSLRGDRRFRLSRGARPRFAGSWTYRDLCRDRQRAIGASASGLGLQRDHQQLPTRRARRRHCTRRGREDDPLVLGKRRTQTGFSPLSQVYEATVATLEERAGGVLGLPTGFYDWDRMTQGLVKGNLIIIAGRPGMGKTSFAVNIAQHVALRENKSVGIFSLEMGEEELAQRILASESDLPFGSVRAGRLSQGQWTQLYDTIRRTTAAPLFIDDSPNPSLLEISSKARRLKAEHGLDLLVIDYLQLMSAGGRYESRQLEISAISRGLKQLAKEAEIPVIALSQLSRQPERRAGDHRPQLADLRESGSIEQDADMVCFIYRDELYNKDDPDNKGMAELIISKHRNGETGTVDMVFFGENTTFRNLDRHHSDQAAPF